MQDLDIKKMLLEGLIKQMGEDTGKSFKKKPQAVVVEKHVSTLPLDSSDDEEEGDEPVSEESDVPEPIGLAKLKRRMGIKSAKKE